MLEQLVTLPMRGAVILDLVLRGAQDLMRGVQVVAPIGNSDQDATQFSVRVNGKLP